MSPVSCHTDTDRHDLNHCLSYDSTHHQHTTQHINETRSNWSFRHTGDKQSAPPHTVPLACVTQSYIGAAWTRALDTWRLPPSAWLRQQTALLAKLAFATGAGCSAAARSKCVAASLSSAAERGPASQVPHCPPSTNGMRATVLSGLTVRWEPRGDAWEAGPRSAAELKKAATHFDRAAALHPAPALKASLADKAAWCRRQAGAM